MYFNSYVARSAAGRVQIEAGAVVDGVQTYNYKEKRWNRESGTVEWETTVITVAELNDIKAALQAKIVQVNRILTDIAKIPV